MAGVRPFDCKPRGLPQIQRQTTARQREGGLNRPRDTTMPRRLSPPLTLPYHTTQSFAMRTHHGSLHPAAVSNHIPGTKEGRPVLPPPQSCLSTNVPGRMRRSPAPFSPAQRDHRLPEEGRPEHIDKWRRSLRSWQREARRRVVLLSQARGLERWSSKPV